jgi:hypothetical protein
MLFAYIGPETMMPVASVIAAVAGVFMMFGRSVVGFGRGLVRRVWPGSGRTKVTKPGTGSTDELVINRTTIVEEIRVTKSGTDSPDEL